MLYTLLLIQLLEEGGVVVEYASLCGYICS